MSLRGGNGSDDILFGSSCIAHGNLEGGSNKGWQCQTFDDRIEYWRRISSPFIPVKYPPAYLIFPSSGQWREVAEVSAKDIT